MKLLDKLFPKAAALKAVQEEATHWERAFGDLNTRHTTLWNEYNALSATAKAERQEANELRAKLREQTDADLLLVSARIVIATLKGNKPEASDLAMQQSLLSQQAALVGGQASYGNPFGALLGGLGLGNVFGH